MISKNISYEGVVAIPKLENWSFIQDTSNPYMAPELRTSHLQGNVYGRKEFEDGTFVTTSFIRDVNLKEKIAITGNTTYELGEISSEFEEWLILNNINIEDYEALSKGE